LKPPKKVYQTLEDRNAELNQLERNGPYACRLENSWLGNGYYFWDTFEENAHWWGRDVRKYQKGYIICQALCDFNDDECLDLHGNIEQLKDFKEAFELYEEKGLITKSHTVKAFLQFLKGEIKSYAKFTAIRVNGIRSKHFQSYYSLNLFYEKPKHNQPQTAYFEFLPAVQICFYTKDSLNLRKYKIVYPDVYNENYVA
jgi:hypothetical protein